MLNELYELSKTLDAYGLLRTITNPNITSVAKGPCLLIEIDKKGLPRETRLLSSEQTGQLWKHSKGNHNSFPAIRVQEPLLAESESEKIQKADWKTNKLAEKLDLLDKLDFAALNPRFKDIQLSPWSRAELAFSSKPDYPELAALEQLIKVFPGEENSLNFANALVNFFKQKMQSINNEAEVNMIKALLVGEWNEKQQKYLASSMTYYDVYESDIFPNLVISSQTRQALIRLLHSKEQEHHSELNQIRSPLSGAWQQSLGDKYPNPNLPLLGLTYFYSKKADIPCLTRYGQSGVKAYQIGKKESNAMNDAIAFLTDLERKGKTWGSMTDCNGDRPNLLLAYLADDPCNRALLAQVLTDPSGYDPAEDNNEEVESLFEALCQQAMGETEELFHVNPEANINQIMLEALDAGRKQVVYARCLTLAQFRANLLTWLEASQNHPPVEIHQWKKQEVIVHKPFQPGPDNIAKLLKADYAKSGQIRFMKQSAVSLHEIYQLYMPLETISSENQAFVNDFLSKTLLKTIRLLGDLGQLQNLHYALAGTKEADTLIKMAQQAISLISILLWHLEIRKENYMRKAAFNVGQLLQLADLLHKEYCIHVRNKGDKSKGFPPQLIGNGFLPTASKKPNEGLNQLRDRLRIYLAWADTTTNEKARYAKKLLGYFGEVSNTIAEELLPEQFEPADEAQVFLGYLAATFEKNADVKGVVQNG